MRRKQDLIGGRCRQSQAVIRGTGNAETKNGRSP